MMRRAASFGLALTLASHKAVAEQASSEAKQYYYMEYESRWYGWQNLAVDVPLLTLYFVAESSERNELALGAFGGFVVGSPIVHLANRRPTPAIFSGFAHLLTPVLGLTVFRSAIRSAAPEMAAETSTAIATTAGGAMATALDAIWISYDETERRVEIDSVGGSWVPQVRWTGQAGWVGLAGTF